MLPPPLPDRRVIWDWGTRMTHLHSLRRGARSLKVPCNTGRKRPLCRRVARVLRTRVSEETLCLCEAMGQGQWAQRQSPAGPMSTVGAAVTLDHARSLAVGQPVWPGCQREGIHPSREPLEEHTPQGQLVQSPRGGEIRERRRQGGAWEESEVCRLPACGKQSLARTH